MDRRNMREIQVTWQLLLFIVALFILGGSIGVIVLTMDDGEPYPTTFLHICYVIVIGSAAIMLIAVLWRLYEAKNEELPDGQPMSGWVLRQVLLGFALCVAGTIIMAILANFGAPRKLAAIGGTVATGPGIILIGRALSSPI